ncbi:dTDP-4-dehydrorhamnose 3,5-epimerase [Spirochaetia bacterium]|nr:dTDP-4-dehydrorhamnose 3,5-epimerase [Spirochaetia bacterium]
MTQKFACEQTAIEGLYVVSPFVSEDERGFFIKDYSLETFEQNGVSYELKEVFYTVSHKGVIRAMHFQRVKQQPKLVRCIFGHVYEVVCDLRLDSPTFGKWLAFELSGENKTELLIPAGCGHGYLVLEESIVSYKCAEKFYGDYDDGIIWNDKDLNISWPLDKVQGEVILSEKDRGLQTFEQFKKVYKGF